MRPLCEWNNETVCQKTAALSPLAEKSRGYIFSGEEIVIDNSLFAYHSLQMVHASRYTPVAAFNFSFYITDLLFSIKMMKGSTDCIDKWDLAVEFNRICHCEDSY